MKIIIIEDEDLSAKDLANTITTLYPDAEIVSILGSIKSCLRFFKQPANADLIFSDIELGDGLIFELFSRVEIDIPIIFCTAYDEYALNAFKANGIEYVLKPYTNNTISNALKKYLALRSMFESKGTNDYQILLKMLNDKKEVEQQSVLVSYKDRILPVKLDNVAFFYLKNSVVHLYTFEQKTYTINKSLDDLERVTNTNFYRANRQFFVNRKTIIDVTNHLSRKISLNLSVPFTEKITVSKEKITHFLNWLAKS